MRYKIYDATKAELLEFISTRWGAPRIIEDIEIWLNSKRSKDKLNKIDDCIKVSEESFKAYVNLLKQANDETEDLNRKIELMERAQSYYEAYERANKAYDKLSKEVDTIFN